MKIKTIKTFLDNYYPLDIASDFDENKIGLVIGDEEIEVKNILLALDLNFEVVNDAIQKDANLIICHHPFIFEPITQIPFNSKIGKVLALMFKHQISLYVMHTNLDVGKNGVNDSLAKLLNFDNIVGEVQKDHFLRIGTTNMIFSNLISLVKKAFNLSLVRTVGEMDRVIRKVGIVGGSGGQIETLDEAINNGCDCLITGEIKLHIAQYAKEKNLSLIEVNHGVERFVLPSVKALLIANLKIDKEIFITEINTDPLEAK